MYHEERSSESSEVNYHLSNGAGFTNRAQPELDPPRRLRKRPQRSEILQNRHT